MHLLRVDLAPVEQRMIVPLDDDQRIARASLPATNHGKSLPVLRAADAQSLPLPERVVRKAVVAPDDAPVRRLDRAGRTRGR